jgi:uncharacterized membrane protein
VVDTPPGWAVSLSSPQFQVDPMDRATVAASLKVPAGTNHPDGWIQLRADCGPMGQPVLASRFLIR